MRVTSTVVLAVALLIGGTIVTQAAAMPPERIDRFTVDLAGRDPCDGFEIVSTGHLIVRVTAFFDGTGVPIRLQVHASRDQTLANSVTGETLDVRGSVVVVIDLTTGWETWLGRVLMSTERGVGSVLQDTGRIVFGASGEPTFVAGPHEGVTNPELVCQLLA